MQPLLSPAAVQATAAARPLVLLDATLLDPALGRDAAAEFAAGHLPDARFLDLATLTLPGAALPNTRPDPATLAARMAALGVAPDAAILLYDDSPWRSAARAWWLLTAAGWRDVALLDGGLAAWRAAGLPLETGVTPAEPAPPAAADADARPTRTLAQMAAPEHAAQIVDARSAARFRGEEAESRAGVVPGHIPGSRSLPYTRLFAADGRWLDRDGLARAFAEAGVDPFRPMVATCGSGITACVLLFAAHLLGAPAGALYDGSWSEYGADPAAPKATGAAA